MACKRSLWNRLPRLQLIVLPVLGILGAQAAPVHAESAVIGPGRFPRLEADASGRLHLLYQENGALSYRIHAGAWSSPEQVPGSTGVNQMKFARHRMRISADGALVYTTWGVGWDTDISFAMRDTGGWQGPEVACSATVRPWEYAAVAAQSTGDIYVFCQVDDLWVAHRSPAGTWTPPVELFSMAPSTVKHVVAGTDATGEVHAFCRQGPVQYIHGAGASWSPRYGLETAGSTELPAFAIEAGGQLFLVWQDWAHVGTDWFIDTLRFATGQDDQWSNGNAGVVVHSYVDQANPPEVAVREDGALAVTWIEGSSVLRADSDNGGATFSAPISIATDARPVQVGSLDTDLRTPPSVFVQNDWHLVYENNASELVHVWTLAPVVGPDAGLPAPDSTVVQDAGGTVDAGTAPDGRAADSGAAPDATVDPSPTTHSGCACDAAHRVSAPLWCLLLFSWVLVRRHRRYRRS